MRARDFLRGYAKATALIEGKAYEREHGGDRERLTAEIAELVAQKCAVIGALERIDSPTEYRVLHMRYIEGLFPAEIAAKFKREYTWVTTVLWRGKKHVQSLLEAEKERGS